MKRQRGSSVNDLKTPKNPPNIEDVVAMGKKKGKKECEQQKFIVVKEEEERKENKDMFEETTIMDIDGLSNPMSLINWEEYMLWLGIRRSDVVDEQMSWGSNWYPAWDMDFMGEAFNSLYSDVVWDDDIWNFNNEIPIPLHENKFEFE